MFRTPLGRICVALIGAVLGWLLNDRAAALLLGPIVGLGIWAVATLLGRTRMAVERRDETEALFRFTADSASFMVWTAREDGDCDWFNRGWLEFRGARMVDELGSGWARGVHADDLVGCLTTYQAALTNRRPFAMEYRLLRTDGEYRSIVVNGRPRLQADGEYIGFIGCCVDVTILKHAHSRIHQLNAAKDDLIAAISHELRTPLAAIIGYAELLEEGIPVPIPASGLEHVERIQANADKLLGTIETVLTFRAASRGELPVVLAKHSTLALMARVLERVAPEARSRKLSLVTDVTEAPLLVHTDDTLLAQILEQLLQNAVKFTRVGEVRLSAEDLGDEVVFRIGDDGVGIPEQDIHRIYEPLFQRNQTLVRQAGGMGLGLTVARELAQVLGGDITTESRVGVGSTFIVRLPNKPVTPAQALPSLA